MQILGFVQGIDTISAYENFRKIFNQDNEYYFKEIIAQEVIGKPIYF